MKMNKLLLFLWLSFAGWAHGQTDFNNYRLIESKGPLPDVFNTSSKEKLDEIKDNTEVKKKDANFYVETTYSLDKFFKSGLVVFNDEIGKYVNKVMALILQKNGMNADVQVYIMKSNVVNAFALNENVIFVTMGLLAQINSEAELAFVLCHEYIHYKNKHVFSGYQNNKKIIKDYKKHKKDDVKVLLSLARYSQDLEKEADIQGFNLYSQTGYNINAAISIFDVLEHSEDPWQNITYTPYFIESRYLKIPSIYFRDSLLKVESVKKPYDQENLNSHPDVAERKKYIEDEIVSQNLNTGANINYQVSESDFLNIRKIARYEVLRLYLLDRSYEKAHYQAFTMMQEEPNSIYLKKILLKSIYGLACYANENKKSKVHVKFEKVNGEMQRLVRAVDNFNSKELSFFTLHYAWQLHQLYPSDIEIEAISNEMMDVCVSYHKLTPSFFKKELPTDSTLLTITTLPKSKKTKKNTGYLAYCFIDLVTEGDDFNKVLDASYKKFKLEKRKTGKNNEEEEEVEEESDSTATTVIKQKPTRDFENVDQIESVDRIMLFEPFSILLDFRKKKDKSKQYTATEKQNAILDNDLQLIAQKLNIQIEIMSNRNIEADPDRLNDLMYVSNFISEKLNHDGVNVLPTDKLKIDGLFKKYSVDYMGLLALIKYKNRSNVLLNIAMIFSVIFSPIGIANLVSPSYNTIFITEIYDASSKSEIYSKAFQVSNSKHHDAILANLYNLFGGLKK
jgi:Zn-dependent protease with chaperone function